MPGLTILTTSSVVWFGGAVANRTPVTPSAAHATMISPALPETVK